MNWTLSLAQVEPVTLRLWRNMQKRTSMSYVFDSRLYRRMSPPMTFQLPAQVEQFSDMMTGLLLAFGCAAQLFLIFPSLILFVASSVFGGTIAGAYISASAGGILARERATRRLELFSVTPAGGFGVQWTLVIEFMRKSRGVRFVNFLTTRFFMIAGLVIGGMVIVSFIAPIAMVESGRNPAAEVQTTFVMLMALCFDYFISVVTGMLVGLLTASYARDGAVSGAIMFLLVQFGFFAVYAIVGIIGLEMLFQALRWFDAPVALALSRLGVYLLMREGLTILLWHQVRHRLNAESHPLKSLIFEAQM